jgi:hypothetical protein
MLELFLGEFLWVLDFLYHANLVQLLFGHLER